MKRKWFDEYLVHSWLPEGEVNGWQVKRSPVTGDPKIWERLNRSDMTGLAWPGRAYTELRDPDGSLWMHDRPDECHDHLEFVGKASGDVLIFGLGMGMLPARLAKLKAVRSIHIVELRQDIIDLVGPHLTAAFPKVTIEQGDVFTYQPARTYDAIWIDVWKWRQNREEAGYLRQRYASTSPIIGCWEFLGHLLKPENPLPRRSFIKTALTASVALLLSPIRSLASASFVRQTAGSSLSGSPSVSLSATPSTGNSLIAVFAYNTGTPPSSVSGGGTWVRDVNNAASTPGVDIWRVHNHDGASGSITVTMSGRSGGPLAYNIIEVSGLQNASPDVAGVTNSGTSSSPSTGSISTSNADDFLVAGLGIPGDVYSSGPTNSFNGGTGSGTGIDWQRLGYLEVLSANSYSIGWTLTGSNTWGTVLAAYKVRTASHASDGWFMNGRRR